MLTKTGASNTSKRINYTDLDNEMFNA